MLHASPACARIDLPFSLLPTLLQPLVRLAVVPPRDEWVRAMAQSVGDYDGRLHNDRLLAVSGAGQSMVSHAGLPRPARHA